MPEEKLIKVAYAGDETGWAIDLGGGRARIRNVPLTDNLNIDDVVLLRTVGGRRVVDKVLERPYAKKSALSYGEPFQTTYDRARVALTEAGVGALEGWIEGLILVAHRADQDPVAVCKTAGVEVWLEQPQPALKVLS